MRYRISSRHDVITHNPAYNPVPTHYRSMTCETQGVSRMSRRADFINASC